mgnify:CR=1 FL=1
MDAMDGIEDGRLKSACAAERGKQVRDPLFRSLLGYADAGSDLGVGFGGSNGLEN